MANACLKKNDPYVELKLSRAEAYTLYIILMQVGGKTSSARVFAQNILTGLNDVGLDEHHNNYNESWLDRSHSCLYFKADTLIPVQETAKEKVK